MNADQIYQSHLDEVVSSILSHNFHKFAETHVLPFQKVAGATQEQITTLGGLASFFDGFLATVALQKVTTILMLVDFSEMVTPELMIGTHFTHLLVGGTRVCQPILCQKTLVRDGGVWRATSAALRVSKVFWPGRPAVKPPLESALE